MWNENETLSLVEEKGRGSTYHRDEDGPSFGCRPDGSTRRTSDQSDPEAGSLGPQQPWESGSKTIGKKYNGASYNTPSHQRTLAMAPIDITIGLEYKKPTSHQRTDSE